MALMNMLKVLPHLNEVDYTNLAQWFANKDGYKGNSHLSIKVKSTDIALMDINKLIKIADKYIRSHKEETRYDSITTGAYTKLVRIRDGKLGTVAD